MSVIIAKLSAVPGVRAVELVGSGWRWIVTIADRSTTAEITLGTDRSVCNATLMSHTDLLNLAELLIEAANILCDVS